MATLLGGFGKVRRRRGGLLVVTVLKEKATDEEFDALIDASESAYVQMPDKFCLVLDLSVMELLPLSHCIKWMELFERVKPVTEARLVCTCVCFQNPIMHSAVTLFLRMYHPIRPFYVCHDRSECIRIATSKQEAKQDGVVDQDVGDRDDAESGDDGASRLDADAGEDGHRDDARDQQGSHPVLGGPPACG